MSKLFAVCVLLASLLLSACGGEAAVSPTPTSAVLQDDPSQREVGFTTADGVVLSGTIEGNRPVVIIFSHMSGGSRAEWRVLPSLFAAKGYTTLAYDFRGRGKSEGSFDPPSAPVDLQAAVDLARRGGAKRIVLVGASMGSMASAKVAATEEVAAVVMLAGTTSWSGLSVSDEEMQAIDAPKLFISSEHDSFIDGFNHLYDAAPEPKEKHIYSGGMHGTDLFDTNGDDLRARIISFIEANAPAE